MATYGRFDWLGIKFGEKIRMKSVYEVTISQEKLFYREKKSIALYSSMHTLCGVYG